MKIIKTYWHADGPDNKPYYLKIKREPLYLFGLSSLLLLKHYTVELYTDPEGKKIIDQLAIPFSKVNVVEKVSVYKAVNDLYVLSLQQEPAVLADDNLLTMGHINFTSQPGIITVLGIDLNSLKLVKAIIKTKRIEENIPFLDDKLWDSKMAYIDASLISTENYEVIRDYYSLVQQFVTRHSAELSKIDHTVIEDFFRRYWFYSYCIGRGLLFETYFENPLQVIEKGINEFGFSGTNITQNFFKVIDPYYSDGMFSLHLIRFFECHFGETLRTIEQYVNRSVTGKVKTPAYMRAKYAYCRIYADKKQNEFPVKSIRTPSLKSITTTISESPGTSQSKLLKDVYDYETYLNKVNKHFLKNAQAISLQQRAAFEKILQYWDVPASQFEKLPLSINPFFFYTESCWKWSTRWVEGVSLEKSAELKVIYNISLDPAYFIAGFIPDTEKNMPFEFNIDKISAEILDFFSGEQTINDFYNHIDRSDLKQFYFNRIKDLLLINVLYINEH